MCLHCRPFPDARTLHHRRPSGRLMIAVIEYRLYPRISCSCMHWDTSTHTLTRAVSVLVEVVHTWEFGRVGLHLTDLLLGRGRGTHNR